MGIKPTGEAVFQMAGKTYRITADELEQFGMVRNTTGPSKETNEGWSVSFTTKHTQGVFTWLVSFSMNDEGTSLDDITLVERPADAQMISDMNFKVYEVQDEDEDE